MMEAAVADIDRVRLEQKSSYSRLSKSAEALTLVRGTDARCLAEALYAGATPARMALQF